MQLCLVLRGGQKGLGDADLPTTATTQPLPLHSDLTKLRSPRGCMVIAPVTLAP